MKKLMTAFFLVACLLSSHVCSENLTVGVEESDYLPIYKGEGLNYTGYARELLDDFARKNGHVFTYAVMPVARLFHEFAVRKSLDLKFPDNAHWAPETKQGVSVVYSKGVITVTEGLMVLPANKGKGKIATIVTQRGFTPYPYLEQINAKKINVSEANSPAAAISMVAAGRGDAVYLGEIAANYLMNEVLKKPGVLVFDDKLPSAKSEFSLSSISHPEVIKQFDEYLVNERVSVARLKAKYKIVD